MPLTWTDRLEDVFTAVEQIEIELRGIREELARMNTDYAVPLETFTTTVAQMIDLFRETLAVFADGNGTPGEERTYP